MENVVSRTTLAKINKYILRILLCVYICVIVQQCTYSLYPDESIEKSDASQDACMYIHAPGQGRSHGLADKSSSSSSSREREPSCYEGRSQEGNQESDLAVEEN